MLLIGIYLNIEILRINGIIYFQVDWVRIPKLKSKGKKNNGSAWRIGKPSSLKKMTRFKCLEMIWDKEEDYLSK